MPFKLTISEIENPVPVIIEFFESFHIQDIRADLLSLYDYSLGHEKDSSQSLFFTYTQVEKLVEACWVIREKLKGDNAERYSLLNPVPPEILGKAATPLELAKSEPSKVLYEIYERYTLTEMRTWLKDWTFVGTNAECNAYDEAESRKQLNLLVNDLNSYFEALLIINSQINKAVSQSTQDNIIDLSRDQVLSPKDFILSFFEKFPITYLRRELFDWLEAGISFTKPWPENFHVGNVLGTYKIFLCLIEAGWALNSTNDHDSA